MKKHKAFLKIAIDASRSKSGGAIEHMKCFLSEALTWEYHEQVDFLRKYLSMNNPNDVLIRFTIPMPKKGSFRVNSNNGSGVFWDMSSYLVSSMNFKPFLAILYFSENT